MPLFLLFLFHLFLNPLSLRLGQISLLIFSLIGRVVHVVIFHTERFYRKYPEYKEKLLLHQALLSRKLTLSASSRLLLKRQLNNSGYKKFYTFFQRLMVVLIYLVLLPDKEEIKRYFSHKLSSIKRYIRLLKTGGLFALYPQTTYKRIPHNKTDLQVVRLIWQVKEANPSWGRVRIAYQLFLLGVVISPSTVRNYLKLPKPPEPDKKQKKRGIKEPEERAANGKIRAKYHNHTWGIDFSVVRVLFSYMYLFFVLDIYSRKIIYFDIHRHNPSCWWVGQRLQRAFSESIDTPKYIITDHGSQFRDAYKAFCRDYGITPRQGKAGSPKANAHIERFIRSLKYEALHHIPFVSVARLRKTVASYVEFYNLYRPHMALKGMTPQMVYTGQGPPKHSVSGVPKMIKRKSFCSGLITAFHPAA